MNASYPKIALLVLLWVVLRTAGAVGQEDSNDCPGSSGDFCERAGSCSIQGADWYQYVTIDRSGIYDTQGWPGLCDMVHVALVQGDCAPPAGQVNVTAWLSSTTFAFIPAITGPLSCGADGVADGDLAPWDDPDGSIDAGDVLIAQQLVLGQRAPGILQFGHGDMNADGNIDLVDLLLIRALAN